MRYATFINFTEKEFTTYWNGRAYTFKPGQRKEHLNEGIAQHFAKHLTNQVLQSGSIPDGEKYTSPKKPTDVPVFMEIFNKAFKIEGDGTEVDAETGLSVGDQEIDQPSMNIKTKKRETIDPYDSATQPVVGPGGAPQIISDEDDEFEGKNK